MKMKRYIAVPAVALLLSLPAFVSCEGWLEATSSSQVSDKKLFSSRSGFHEALSGVYLAMAKTEAYGGDYTWRINDLVCVPYTSQSGTFFRAFQQQNYTASVAVPYLEKMWQGGYNIIANANKVLQELEKGRAVEYGPTDHILNHPETEYTKILMAAVPRLNRGGAANG